MPDFRTPEDLEAVRSAREQEEQKYTPRPRWQVAMAWVLVAIVILGVINVCYWQFSI